MVVEDDLGVGVVVDNDDVVLPGESNELFIEGPGRRHAHGVGRVGHHHHLGLPGQLRVDGVQVRQVAVLRPQLVIRDFRAAEHGTHFKDGVAGVGHQHHVAGVADGQADVGQPLLGAVDGHDLILLQLHAVAGAIPVLHGLQQLGQLRQGVFVVLRGPGGVTQGLHHVGRGLKVRGADGQVVHLPARGLHLPAFLVQHAENTGLELVHPAGKLKFHGNPSDFD